jgi:predicted KAP-like P-loop ATPase
MWSDNETALDLLNIEHYVSSVIELATDDALLPVTIGIFGDWGNGKSSLLKMVQAVLDKRENTLCLYFNGWLFEDYDDAKAALMGTILDEIEKKRKPTEKVKEKLDNLRKRVNWLGLMGVTGKYGLSLLLGGPLGGVGALSADAGKLLIEKIKSGEVDDVTKLVKSTLPESSEVRKNILDFKEEFSELLNETNIDNLIVIIDDLDRCLPDTIINTLEAIKLFLSSKNTAFLISIDERVIKYAINDRYNKFDARQKDDISRDYLEKLIQIPLKVPLMNKREMKSYINLLFASKHMSSEDFTALLKKVSEAKQGNNFNIAIDLQWLKKNITVNGNLQEELLITEQINELLYDFLKGNPRQVKRFINALLLRMKLARLRGVTLNKQMLAKLMALEYMHINYFRQLADWQSTQNGKPKELSDFETKAKEEKQKQPQDTKTDWLQNEWLVRWLKAEPRLSGENLEPYFYISRESLLSYKTQTTDLTDTEIVIFEELIAESETHRNKGKRSFSQVTDIEAINIITAVIDKCQKMDFETEENKDILLTLVSLINIKSVVAENIIDFISSVDTKHIQPAIVLELKKAQQDGTSTLSAKISELFEEFKKSENDMLVNALES